MYIFGLITLTFFAVIGLASFINAIMTGSCDDGTQLRLSSLNGGDAEARLRTALRICDEIRCMHLICECTDSEARAICERLKRDNPIITIE